MSRVRWISTGVVVVLLVILVFQNLEPVSLRVLAWKLQVVPAALIALCYLVGALTGRPLYRLFTQRLFGRSSAKAGETEADKK